MRGTTILFPLLILSVIALLTYWININVQPVLSKQDAAARHDPDYMVENFISTQTDKTGALRYKLQSKEMQHFPDDDTTLLKSPVYTQYVQDKSYLQVEGLIGDVSGAGNDIKLYKNVKVTRAPYGDKQEMTLETDYLNILPNEDLVLTQRPVVIRQAPKTVVYANGMVYEKQKLTVTLLNKVRAHYEKPVNNSKKIDTLANANDNATKNEVADLRNKANAPTNLPEPEVSWSKKMDALENQQHTPAPQQPTRVRRRYE
jgi:lipopolysaccharide export system protein LptC